ncbi:MAG: dihydrolipoyl dehydrogenase [Proteobacteria bacterium]|nr:dihydrolipoyl dehydrogenase [Pseudomonadota bacterium]
MSVEQRVPDLGGVHDAQVADVLVKPGDRVAVNDALITLETDKASMDVPATVAGTISTVALSRGAKVSQGDLIATLEPDPAAAFSNAAPPSSVAAGNAVSSSSPVRPATQALVPAADIPADAVDLLVLGAGPGGYTAAFRAADLGMKVTLVERWPTLGGVCLNVGCIPSKALLHAARVIEEVHEMRDCGISFGEPRIDLDKLRAWKGRVVGRLTGGLSALAKQRKVNVVQGTGRFTGPHSLDIAAPDGSTRALHFRQCIIAAGSESARLPGLPEDPRIMDSTGALELPADCKRLLIVGGGIIGLEMACVYDALGVRVSVVELLDQLMPGADRDLLRPLQKRIEKRYERILLGTKVSKMTVEAGGVRVSFEGANAPADDIYDRVLIAVGRTANGQAIDAAKAGVNVERRGTIEVDRQMRTNVPHIFAIGDIVGQPMLAHKATHEAKVAAEVAAGHKSYFDARCIPSVAYTDPEIAWVGLTETQAKEQGLDVGKAVFPWAASGRSLAINRDEGLTKLLFDNSTRRLLGAGIVGPNAGELVAEAGLAIEMGADAADVGLTIHAHPTLSETVAMAAEAFEGTLTDLYIPGGRKR